MNPFEFLDVPNPAIERDVVPLEKRDAQTWPQKSGVTKWKLPNDNKNWRPQPDLNRCCRRERPMSWTWLDDGDPSGPCANRTRDQRIKSPLLYRTELTAHECCACINLVTLLACGVKKNIKGTDHGHYTII